MKKFAGFSIFVILSLAFIFQSCDNYQRVMKSDDINLKYQASQKYYEKKDYTKALGLLEELVMVYRGNQEIYYQYADCHYHLHNYQTASYHFKNFAESYPISEKAEDAYYMFAYCLYLESPLTDLDQSSTEKAVNAFQLFLNKYPDTKKVDECNKRIDELGKKLEIKELETAMLYYQINDYKAALWALNSYLNSYPTTNKKEEIEYTIIRAAVALAINSTDRKKKERMENVLEYANDFMQKYSSSKYLKEIKRYQGMASSTLKKINN